MLKSLIIEKLCVLPKFLNTFPLSHQLTLVYFAMIRPQDYFPLSVMSTSIGKQVSEFNSLHQLVKRFFMSIYVGNLSSKVTQKDLNRVLSQYGKVNRVQLSIETEIRQMKAAFFIEMETEAEEEAAIQALNGTQWRGSCLIVNKAQDNEEQNLSGRGVTGHFN